MKLAVNINCSCFAHHIGKATMTGMNERAHSAKYVIATSQLNKYVALTFHLLNVECLYSIFYATTLHQPHFLSRCLIGLRLFSTRLIHELYKSGLLGPGSLTSSSDVGQRLRNTGGFLLMYQLSKVFKKVCNKNK